MAFQRKLPTSAALRPGGEGIRPPAQEDAFNLGSMKGPKSAPIKGPAKIGKGVTPPKMPKAPSAPKIPKMPKIK